MVQYKHLVSVFEHDVVYFDKGEKRITEAQFRALEKYFEKGTPFFSLQRNGVRFNEHVGVIQVGNTLIEVLPKADKASAEEARWRALLIGMLKAVGAFDIRSTSNSSLNIKPNTILDLYFELFISEVEYLLHQGLMKQYRRKQGNVTTLKGSLLFGKHIQHNLTHQERFYVRHTTYDVQHTLHHILYKAMGLLRHINTNAALHSRIGALLLHFPEMPDITITPATFAKLVFSRKNQSYQKAINIAKHILLQYHPDVSHGRNHVLALMFDMNALWEKFVYISLRHRKPEGVTVEEQVPVPFWKPQGGTLQKMRPDIVINKGCKEKCAVLDTKWKNLGNSHPSPDDLRQVYAYHEFFGAKKVALVYPGTAQDIKQGHFRPTPTYLLEDKQCSVIIIKAPEGKLEKDVIKRWQEKIRTQLNDWLQPD